MQDGYFELDDMAYLQGLVMSTCPFKLLEIEEIARLGGSTEEAAMAAVLMLQIEVRETYTWPNALKILEILRA